MITTRGDRGGGAQRPPQRDCLRHGRGRGGGTPALGDRGQHYIATASGIRRDRHLLFEVEMYLQKGCIMVSGVGSS